MRATMLVLRAPDVNVIPMITCFVPQCSF